MKTTIKCPWCGRQVEWHKGRIPPHVQSPRVQCVGSGQPRDQVEAHAILHAAVRAENTRAPRFGEVWVLPDGTLVKFVGRAGTRRGWQYADGLVVSDKLHTIRPALPEEGRRFARRVET